MTYIWASWPSTRNTADGRTQVRSHQCRGRRALHLKAEMGHLGHYAGAGRCGRARIEGRARVHCNVRRLAGAQDGGPNRFCTAPKTPC